MWIKRQFNNIWLSEHTQPVRILVGMRQTGKSAFLDHVAEGDDRKSVTFDDQATRAAAMENPRQFLNQLGSKVTIDEAHYVPELFPVLKIIVDDYKKLRRQSLEGDEPSYWLTGSNRVLLEQTVAESLTGRASYFRFHGLSVAEIFESLNDVTISEILMRGGWPELYARRQIAPVTYLNDYISTSLEKDISAIGIEKVAEFIKLLRFVSGRVGRIFDLAEVAKDARVRSQTVFGWLEYAVRMMILQRIDIFSTNVTTRLIKSPKYFFLDTALAVRLQGWAQVEPLLVSPAIGQLFENLVLSEIIKTRDCYLPALEVAHWRTKDQEEVDFILTQNGKHLAVEAKFSANEADTYSLPKEVRKIPGLSAVVVSFEGPSAFNTPIRRGPFLHVALRNFRDFLCEFFA